MPACHRCGTAFGLTGSVSRQDSCAKCHAFLRSCRNCAFYDPRNKNDCAEPEAEPVGDKEAANFCEFFAANARSAGEVSGSPARGAKEKAGGFDSLFGGGEKSGPSGDPFDSLFKK